MEIPIALDYSYLGKAYSALAKMKDTKKNCQTAINFYNMALDILNRIDYPIYYTEIMSYLTDIHFILAQVEETDKNCQLAKKYLKETLQVFNEKDYPERYKLLEGIIDKVSEIS